jgi:DNA-binding CsgD family transcriptional regulator
MFSQVVQLFGAFFVPLAPAAYEQLLTAIDRLYAAALDPSKWKAFLQAAAEMLKADNAYVSEIAHDSGTLEYVVLRQLNWDAISVGRYTALMDEDPRMPAFRSNPYLPLHCRMVVSEQKLHESRTYREALKPLGIEYTLVVGIPGERDLNNFLGFTRTSASPPFDVADCEMVSELVPHLARGFAIRRALNRKEPVPALFLPPSAPRRAESKERILERLFDLSPRQARLAALLMTGRRIKEIAPMLEITEGSARQYLKRVFKKTGTRRQADLVRVVGEALVQHS